MGIFSQKKEIREAKEAAGAIQYAGAAGMEAASAQTARDIAAQQTQFNVFSQLGAPGTYGPGAASGGGNPQGGIFNTTGEGLSLPDQNLKGMLSYGGRGLIRGVREGILDPEAASQAVTNTASFRIQSQQVAESEQLLNQEGPAWDMLNNSIMGTINEGAAMQLRDTMRQLKNNAAKGGTARRTALNEANQYIASERAMRTRVQETWQANLKLHDYVRQNADRVAAGTARFMDTIPLMNSAYSDSMRKNAELQISAGRFAIAASTTAFDISSREQTAFENFYDSNERFFTGVAKTAIGAAAAKYGGGGAGMTAATSQYGDPGLNQMNTNVFDTMTQQLGVSQGLN